MDEIIRRNHVRVTGSGKQVVMFAHGFGIDQESWRFIVPAFENEFRVVLFDYVGCGRSDSSAYDRVRYSRLEGYARDVIEIAEATGIRDMIFVGHSVSGMIGMLAALEKPYLFSALVFIGASPRYINDAGGYQGGFDESEVNGIITAIGENFHEWAHLTIPVIIRNQDKPELVWEVQETFKRVDEGLAKRFAEATFFSDHRKQLLDFEKPVLILQNRNDSMSPLHVGDYLHAHLRNSLLKVLDAEGHFPQLTAPEELINVIGPFIRSQRTESRLADLPGEI